MMHSRIRRANVEFDNEESTITEAVAKGTVDVAEALEAKLIVVGTGTGRAAKSLRKYFPTARILALTNSQTTANQLLLSRGVLSVVAEKPETLDCFFKQAEAEAVKTGLVKSGDIIVRKARCTFKILYEREVIVI